MIRRRARADREPIDIAPGAAARLRLRPELAVQDELRPVAASRSDATAPERIFAPAGESEELGALRVALARAQAERDAAMEDVEFLREQLRGTQSYLGQLLEKERATWTVECAALLGELALLDAELAARV